MRPWGNKGPIMAEHCSQLTIFFFSYHKGSGTRQVNYSELATHLE